MNDQQLVARIKRSSKYWGQTPPNKWFDVEVVADNYYQLRGNNNNYRISDVVMGVRLDNGAVLDLTSGKKTPTKPTMSVLSEADIATLCGGRDGR